MMEKTKRKGTRTGFTTGACSAAAARAAVVGLVSGNVPSQIECLLPNRSVVSFAVNNGQCNQSRQNAHAMVIKDAGDDPDCTDRAQLTADVRICTDLPPGEVRIVGGAGVGTVTMPGLGLEVGKAAINPVPMQNIEENVRAAGASLLETAGLEVAISVPQGEEMARKTLNARLGILGGISILGTTGIVKPYSTAAYRASVVQGVEVAATVSANEYGAGTVVLTTGGRTEKFVMRELADLPPACFVQMGDFLRYALDTAVKVGLKKVVIGGMVGKLTKIAQGETITHANRARVNTALLADIAGAAGADAATCTAIAEAPTARFASETMAELGLADAFHHGLAQRVIRTLTQESRYGLDSFELEVLMCDFDGNRIAQASSRNTA